MNYYYLGASLPSLSMSVKPSLSTDDFRLLAEQHLSPADKKALAELDAVFITEPEHPFAIQWKEKEVSLRNALVRMRAANLKKEPEPFIRLPDYYDSESWRTVNETAGKQNPLDKEHMIDRCRWNALDEMSGLDQFSSSAILAYFLKLRIAERWGSMDEKAGMKTANEIISKPDTQSLSSKS